MPLKSFPYTQGKATIVLQDEAFYYWDSSVIEDGGSYHLFASRWPSYLGFGWNWLFNSEIVHLVSHSPEGPFVFANVVLPRRGKEFFDGMNTHNPCLKKWGGNYYLYYMGATYDGPIPGPEGVSPERALAVWNKKRIGLAISSSIDGSFVRQDRPILEPRGPSKWDCTVTTNPAVAILPDGTTYMIYKSRKAEGQPLKLGVAKASRPDGVFERLSDEPILQYDDLNIGIEDPYLWYDEARKLFCLIAKDDSHNGSRGLTGEWGSGFYAESSDCVHFRLSQHPMAYSRNVAFADGKKDQLCNLERPTVLFDGSGQPIRLYFAGGKGPSPYAFVGTSFILSVPLIPLRK